ncbi:MAG: hypothetical protein ACRDRJ_31825 [Streptosporangiaceae bacterium]
MSMIEPLTEMLVSDGPPAVTLVACPVTSPLIGKTPGLAGLA